MAPQSRGPGISGHAGRYHGHLRPGIRRVGGWGTPSVEILTAGFKPPLSINLRFGLQEAFLSLAVNLVGILGGWYLLRRLREHVQALILFLMIVMGINGMVMTRDLFNLFVFIEITAIATYALIGLEQDRRILTAGFKYVMAGGLASSFFLIGTILVYHLTGTLNIDGMIAERALLDNPLGISALVFLIAGVVIELKPFPANGWGLDVYEAAPGGYRHPPLVGGRCRRPGGVV